MDMTKRIMKKPSWQKHRPVVVACTCNPATLEAKFRYAVASIPADGNSLSIVGWIVWPPVIQH